MAYGYQGRRRRALGQIGPTTQEVGGFAVDASGNITVPGSSIVLTPDQFANINAQNYEQGTLNAPSTLPDWALPVGIGVVLLFLLGAMKK